LPFGMPGGGDFSSLHERSGLQRRRRDSRRPDLHVARMRSSPFGRLQPGVRSRTGDKAQRSGRPTKTRRRPGQERRKTRCGFRPGESGTTLFARGQLGEMMGVEISGLEQWATRTTPSWGDRGPTTMLSDDQRTTRGLGGAPRPVRSSEFLIVWQSRFTGGLGVHGCPSPRDACCKEKLGWSRWGSIARGTAARDRRAPAGRKKTSPPWTRDFYREPKTAPSRFGRGPRS